MKKEKLIFLTVPIIQVLSSARYFKTYQQVVSSFLFILSSFLISLLLYKCLCTIFLKCNILNKYKIFPLLMLFSFLDQTHKYLLEITGFNCNIIGELFKVKQTKNENQMAILNYFSIEINTAAIICFKIILFIILICCLFKVKNTNLKISFTLLASAQLSSILDSLLRGYVLDSFYYYKLVCYDLKDYYADAGIAIILIAIIFMQKNKGKIQ